MRIHLGFMKGDSNSGYKSGELALIYDKAPPSGSGELDICYWVEVEYPGTFEDAVIEYAPVANVSTMVSRWAVDQNGIVPVNKDKMLSCIQFHDALDAVRKLQGTPDAMMDRMRAAMVSHQGYMKRVLNFILRR